MDNDQVFDDGPARPGPREPGAGDEGGIVAFLQRGGDAVVLTGPPGSGKTALLDAVLAQMTGIVMRIGNPLQTPLTLSRVLLQLGVHGPEEDDEEALRRELASFAERSEPVLLAIDDAHTAVPELWPILADHAVRTGTSAADLRLLIAGLPAVLDALPPVMAGSTEQTVTMRVTLGSPAAGPAEAASSREAPMSRLSEPRRMDDLADGPLPIPSPPPPRRRTRVVREPEPAALGLSQPLVLSTALTVTPAAGLPLPKMHFGSVNAVMRARPAPIDLDPLPPSSTGRAERWGAVGAMLLLLVLATTTSLQQPAAPPTPDRFLYAHLGDAPGPDPAEDPAPRPSEAAPVAPAPNPASTPASTATSTLAPTPAPAPTASIAEAPVPAPAAPQVPQVALSEPPRTPAAAPVGQAAPSSTIDRQETVAFAPSAPSRTTEAELRREFDAFLHRTGWDAATPTPRARRALFHDYKNWLSRRNIGMVQ